MKSFVLYKMLFIFVLATLPMAYSKVSADMQYAKVQSKLMNLRAEVDSLIVKLNIHESVDSVDVFPIESEPELSDSFELH